MKINKIINPVKRKTSGGRVFNVFCKIEYDGKKLSITGVEGPLASGNCLGSAGQIDMDWGEYEKRNDFVSYGPGWNKTKEKRFLEIWDKWHLNDMQAGCEHQRAWKWADRLIDPAELSNDHANRDKRGVLAVWVTEKEHPKGLLSKKCLKCGYKYGSAWLTVPVPADALLFLHDLPETTIIPAWC